MCWLALALTLSLTLSYTCLHCFPSLFYDLFPKMRGKESAVRYDCFWLKYSEIEGRERERADLSYITGGVVLSVVNPHIVNSHPYWVHTWMQLTSQLMTNLSCDSFSCFMASHPILNTISQLVCVAFYHYCTYLLYVIWEHCLDTDINIGDDVYYKFTLYYKY